MCPPNFIKLFHIQKLNQNTVSSWENETLSNCTIYKHCVKLGELNFIELYHIQTLCETGSIKLYQQFNILANIIIVELWQHHDSVTMATS